MNISRRTRALASAVVGALALTALTGCTGGATAAERDTFVIAYLPDEAQQHHIDARSSLAEHLSAAIGMPVEDLHATDYAAVVEAMRHGHADMALFGPLAFTLAAERADAVPLAIRAPEGDPERAVHFSKIFVRSDSDIRTLDDIEGRTMVFVDPVSTTGALLPAHTIASHFPDRDLTMESLQVNGMFFESVSFSGNHQASLVAVMLGDAEVGAVYEGVLYSAIARGEIDADDIRILHVSDPVPGSPIAVRGTLDPDLIDTIRDFLLAFDDDTYFYGIHGDATVRYVPTSIDDFAELIALHRRMQAG